MRCDPIILYLAQKIGDVSHVENSNSYRNKTSGQRVKILVSSLEDLLERIFPNIEDIGIDDGVLVEYLRLPNQCGRCRKMDHESKLCPKNTEPSQPNSNSLQFFDRQDKYNTSNYKGKCHISLLEECPQHHGHKGDPE